MELIAELASFNTEKKRLGICLPGKRLLPHMPEKCHEIAENFMKANSVEIIYNTPYIADIEKQLGYDLVFKCVGQKFKSPYIEKNFGQC